MDYKELKNKGLKELHESLAENREELRSLRFEASENQLKNVKKIDKIKKDIARILTFINSKK
ncbi:MAG: 50S ribosomal protein L29 [Patescibacteria group bacterium]